MPGPIVLHQVPSGSIVPTTSSSAPQTACPSGPLIDFAALSSYIIPRQEFCDQPMSICSNGYRVIGHPVCITDPTRYTRNEYIFNLAVVVLEGEDMSAYVTVVKKIARLCRDLEVQTEFLSKDEGSLAGAQGEEGQEGDGDQDGGDEGDGGGGKVYALCDMVLEDLNNYSECMIPIDETNTLNLKLFPTYPNPPPVNAWHVPLSTVHLPSMTDSTWDLTMLRIIPYINGVTSVRNIALLADADYDLTQKAISHLLYYRCLLLLDIFHFSAIYAPTAEIEVFFTNRAMQIECAGYITTTGEAVETDRLLKLYARLRQTVSVADWCMANAECLRGIDVRRMITFGVIKGFLYRVQKYAIASNASRSVNMASAEQVQSPEKLLRSTNGWMGSFETKDSMRAEPAGDEVSVMRFLDGTHCFDEICTELRLTEPELLEKLKTTGDVQVIHR